MIGSCAGFEAAVREANASPVGRRNGGNVLMGVASEKALLTSLLNRLAALDADALVGHNISAFDLDVLLHRLEKHKVCFQPQPTDQDACGIGTISHNITCPSASSGPYWM